MMHCIGKWLLGPFKYAICIHISVLFVTVLTGGWTNLICKNETIFHVCLFFFCVHDAWPQCYRWSFLGLLLSIFLFISYLFSDSKTKWSSAHTIQPTLRYFEILLNLINQILALGYGVFAGINIASTLAAIIIEECVSTGAECLFLVNDAATYLDMSNNAQ